MFLYASRQGIRIFETKKTLLMPGINQASFETTRDYSVVLSCFTFKVL